MKVYNKLVESKKEPQNKNDIWFDGSVFRIYKEGDWIPITLTKEAAERLIEYANSLYVYVIVDELPESGEEDKIYILRENIGGSSVKLEEYIWDNGWKFVDNFNSVNIKLDSPFEKGDAENSAVLKGEYQGHSNKALSQTSMAVGAGTIAGLKGWYYSGVDFGNAKITLSDRPTYILAGQVLLGGSWSSGEPNIKAGDKVSIVNNSKYDYCGEVASVSGNVITLKEALPFTSLTKDDGAAVAVHANKFSDGYSIYLPDKPDAGIIDFGGGAFAEGGLESKASNICAHAEGLTTHAYGQYSHTEGRETKASYASHAEGQLSHAEGQWSHAEGYQTVAKGKMSHAEGHKTIALGNYTHAEGFGNTVDINPSTVLAKWEADKDFLAAVNNQAHAEGNTTLAYGKQSHAEGLQTLAQGNQSHSEGYQTVAQGNRSHAEGSQTSALGLYSHAEGEGTIANNAAEHASGQYNVSIPKTEENTTAEATQFSIGIGTGTSEDDRKNAFEVKQNGDIYIEGVEGRIQDKLNGGSSATPDWNAQKGEPGHIENRTHCLIGKHKHTLGKGINKINYVHLKFILFNNIVQEIPDFKNNLEFQIVSGPPVYLKYITENDGKLYIELIDVANYFGNSTIEFYATIKEINNVYLPNTILKTTPQTLSDTDKNQALANLGIDPVVWKYMCNPIDINPILHGVDLDGNEDILGEKYRPENYGCEVYKFKPNVCAGMFRQIYHPTKTLGELWNISYINHDEGMITFSGPGGDEIMFAVIDDGECIIWHEVDW